MFERQEKSPKVLGAPSVVASAVVHVLFFLFCFWAAMPMKEKEVVIPIDLTVVVQENLDGNEDEPPPLEPPKPEPPEPEPPKPEPPKPRPEPPKPDPPKPPDAVVKEVPKTNDVVKAVKEQPKPEQAKPKPEPPKKESREERIKRIRESMNIVKAPSQKQQPTPQPNGRTGPKTLSDAEIARMLAGGARAGRVESLATDEATRCVSLIYRTFYDKWVSPPYSPALGTMVLEVHFDSGGRVVSTRLTRSSGDAAADKSVRDVGNVVKYVAGLTPAFLREHPVVTVTFEVKPQ